MNAWLFVEKLIIFLNIFFSFQFNLSFLNFVEFLTNRTPMRTSDHNNKQVNLFVLRSQWFCC